MSDTFVNEEAKNLFLGKFGENVASDFLQKNGYEICGKNVRFGRYELDIIAQDENFLVFVEVKTRSCLYPESGVFGTPGSAVTHKKRTDTLKAATEYLRKNHTSKQPRIDVIEVYIYSANDQRSTPPQVLNINHIRNAFDARGRKH